MEITLMVLCVINVLLFASLAYICVKLGDIFKVFKGLYDETIELYDKIKGDKK